MLAAPEVLPGNAHSRGLQEPALPAGLVASLAPVVELSHEDPLRRGRLLQAPDPGSALRRPHGSFPLFEELGDRILFLRPRRFGKSLWLSTLAAYHDLRLADEHERLFGDLATPG